MLSLVDFCGCDYFGWVDILFVMLTLLHSEAKTLWSFGFFECNRVNASTLTIYMENGCYMAGASRVF